MACPLCGKHQFIKRNIYDTSKIIKEYRDIFSLDVSAYFDSENLEFHQCSSCGLGFFPKGIEGKSDFYEALSKVDWYYMRDKYEYEYALQKLMDIQPTSILEIGCGKGYFLDKIKDSYFVRATEQNVDAIKALQEKGILLDDDKTSYDLIVSFQVLEHVKDLHAFLNWIIAKLNPGGQLLITMPNADSVYMKEFFQITDFPPHHINRIGKKTLYKLSAIFNLKIVDYFEEPLNDIHLRQVLDTRKKALLQENSLSEELQNIIIGTEMAILPMVRDILPFKGHTHGILLKKEE